MTSHAAITMVVVVKPKWPVAGSICLRFHKPPSLSRDVASAVGASTSHHVMPAADTVLGIDHNVIDSEHLSMLIVNL
jgi:hypothetical protein